MNIKETDLRVMRGPNYWSVEHHNIIVITIDLKNAKDLNSVEAENLKKNSIKLFPDLSETINKSFDEWYSKDNARLLAVLCQEFACGIMSLSGMRTVYGDVDKVSNSEIYHICFAYDDEEAGWQAASFVLRILNDLVKNELPDLEREISVIKEIKRVRFIGPSTNSIIEAANKKGVPVFFLHVAEIVVLGMGKYLKRIQAAISEETRVLAADLARNKEDTKKLLDKFFIPVPHGYTVNELNELEEIEKKLKYPVAVKPLHGHHGNGVTTNIPDLQSLKDAFLRAKEFADSVIVERFISGNDYRLLMVNHKFVAAAQRIPASVKGDGKHSVRELIEIVNANPRRGEGHENFLSKIVIDDIVIRLLSKKGMELNSVPKKDEVIFLKETANLSTGGTAVDVTDEIHPDNIEVVQRASRLIGLDVCGIDIIAKDLSTPFSESGAAIIEVNAAPGLRMHFSPAEGTPRDVSSHIIEFLFPGKNKGRIPIVAITGTNGKTTTARLMAHMADFQAYRAGLTSTDGIYLGGMLLAQGDYTGVKSAEIILQDPATEFAVLECARGGILRSGLAFDYCDIGIVMNVGDDHLGLKQVNTLEDMARVKAVVAKAATAKGFAVLNAEDDLVYEMRKDITAQPAFFSLDPQNPRIKKHLEKDNSVAASVVNGYVTILKSNEHITLGHVREFPITFDGKATFNIQNILAAALSAYLLKFDVLNIRNALKHFYPSPEQSPGRMNFFDFGKFKVVVDYAHNPPSIKALGDFFSKMKGQKKTGIITGVGDRREDYLIEIGKKSAGAFDNIIIRIDEDTRGRDPEEIAAYIAKGIEESGKNVPYTVIPDEKEAIRYAVEHAVDDEIIVVATEKVKVAIEKVKELREKIYDANYSL